MDIDSDYTAEIEETIDVGSSSPQLTANKYHFNFCQETEDPCDNTDNTWAYVEQTIEGEEETC